MRLSSKFAGARLVAQVNKSPLDETASQVAMAKQQLARALWEESRRSRPVTKFFYEEPKTETLYLGVATECDAQALRAVSTMLKACLQGAPLTKERQKVVNQALKTKKALQKYLFELAKATQAAKG